MKIIWNFPLLPHFQTKLIPHYHQHLGRAIHAYFVSYFVNRLFIYSPLVSPVLYLPFVNIRSVRKTAVYIESSSMHITFSQLFPVFLIFRRNWFVIITSTHAIPASQYRISSTIGPPVSTYLFHPPLLASPPIRGTAEVMEVPVRNCLFHYILARYSRSSKRFDYIYVWFFTFQTLQIFVFLSVLTYFRNEALVLSDLNWGDRCRIETDFNGECRGETVCEMERAGRLQSMKYLLAKHVRCSGQTSRWFTEELSWEDAPQFKLTHFSS